MKNHPVNNDYVQNLVEGLQFESRKGAPGSAKARIQDADSENRREAAQEHADETASEDGGYGVRRDIENGDDQGNIRDQGGSRQTKKVPGAKTPRPRKNTAGRVLKRVVESFDITDSRLSDEDAKIDQNVKTRGVKKKKGEKPVPMTNSDGEKIGEQDSGTRPRSQDLNTRGRLNKSREGEGMIAKGKRFIKKKFA